ncbi:uncharacterized protein RHOBADRAFT_44986 [Rhodotorula graminis WP1]|uniref:Citrate transporter-like domain-containing protein n=1 Tax=Rhodotorula graminis (strain WP1) TaxID=578459 RepID=A0A194S1M8_RHOGW|nr:uncharacterized protein RHOBADRAFT_44986 [Rhodotorula graminis WP1]KPV74497.1 hypothetical protein RHOBADRAFT_44986 [Rhodotorula graminis WP1]
MAGLTARSWVALVVYAVVMGLVIKGFTIPVPRVITVPLLKLAVRCRILDPPALAQPTSPQPDDCAPPSPKPSTTPLANSSSRLVSTDAPTPVWNKRLSLVLDLRTAPVVGCIFLLATTVIDGSVVRLGIVGEDGVRPYDVLVLFISLAYISTALDSTGGLRALAFWISQKSARHPPNSPPSAPKTASGLRLFTILYCFWFFFGVLVGNDPIVLSGTAFLGYFTRATGIAAPRAWTMSQFVAANVASAALVSSNPTNVLIAGAWGLNFLTGFTAYTILPATITALVAYPLLLFLFTFFRPSSSPSDASTSSRQRYIPAQLLPPDVDPRSALVDPRGAVFHATLMLVTLGTLVGTSFVGHDLVQVWMVTAPAGVLAFARDLWSERRPPRVKDEIELADAPTHPVATPPVVASSNEAVPARPWTAQRLVAQTCRRFPTTSSTVSRLPLSLLPFAGGIFVLARALTATGWTDIFATWLVRVCVNPAATVFFVGYITALFLCPLCGTNIGGTILAVEILRSPTFSSSARVVADPRILQGAIYSLALASNVGALSWTVSSSLAGLLWVRILAQKGIRVTQREFALWLGGGMLVLLEGVACAVVLLEVYYWNL